MSDQEKSRLAHPTNILWGTQLLTLSLVIHMWFDMMGEFQNGGRIASYMIVAGLLVYMAPAIEVAYERIRGEIIND